MACIDPKDKREYFKQYREQNKDKIAEKCKQYYEQNKDKIAELKKQYREQNKDKIKKYREHNKDEIAEQRKQYREDNKDRIAEYKKQYHEQNKDDIAEQRKQYYEQNKDKLAKYKKQYNEQNKDKLAEKGKQYYEQNKDKIAELKKQYREQNKDKAKQYYEQNKDKIKKYQEQNKDDIAERMKQYRQEKYKCKSEHCSTQATQPKYKGYCFRCFLHTYPDEEVPRNYKIKERHVQDYLTEHFKDAFTYDKVISGGCSRFRPDWFCDMLTHSIVVECDENQHQDYSCENKRMMTLFEDLGNRPLVFIRFNPDGYIDDSKKRHNSCFKYHQTLGTPIVANQKDWNKRLCALKDTIQHHMDNIPNKEVFLEHLFYTL
jgi:hypothetical protein